MSGKQAKYSDLMSPMGIVGAVRLLEIKATNEGKINYEGAPIEDIKETVEKLGAEINEKEFKKAFRIAYDFGQLRITYDSENKRRLYSIQNYPTHTNTIDSLLQLCGIIEIEPKKVKLKIEI